MAWREGRATRGVKGGAGGSPSGDPLATGRVGSPPSSGASAQPACGLPLERIRELQEDLPVGADEVVPLVEDAGVAVAEEEDRLPVQLVAEERRREEVAALLRHVERVEDG